MADTRRRDLIARHLRSNPAQSQDSLTKYLRKHGIDTTQATVSRDLAAMGALKGPHGYVLPDEASGAVGAAPEASVSVICSHALAVLAADSIVVLQTAPGHADVVAVELDRWPPTGVVGCIAGDDTIFLATTSKAAAKRVAASLGDMLAGKG